MDECAIAKVLGYLIIPWSSFFLQSGSCRDYENTRDAHPLSSLGPLGTPRGRHSSRYYSSQSSNGDLLIPHRSVADRMEVMRLSRETFHVTTEEQALRHAR